MNFCGQCGNAVRPGAAFCGYCGAPLSAMPDADEPTRVPASASQPATPDSAESQAWGNPDAKVASEWPSAGTSSGGPGAPHAGEAAWPSDPGPAPRQRPAAFKYLPTNPATWRNGFADAVASTAINLAFLFILVAILSLWLGTSGHHGSVIDWVRSAIFVHGLALHGTLNLSASAISDSVLHGSIWIRIQPLLFTAIAMLPLILLTRRRVCAGQGEYSGVLPAAVATAVAYAVVALVLAAATHGLGYGAHPTTDDDLAVSVRLGLGFGFLLLGALVFSFLTVAGTRLQMQLRSAGSGTMRWLWQRSANWAAAISTALTALLLMIVLSSIAVVVYVLVETPFHDWGYALLATLLALPNAAIALAGLSSGATLGASAAGSASGAFEDSSTSWLNQHQDAGVGLLAGHLPGWMWVFILISIISVVVAGVRAEVRRDPTNKSWGTWYQPGLALAAFWLVLALLTRIDVGSHGRMSVFGADGSGSISGALTLGLPSLLLLAFAWGSISYASGRLLTGPVAAMAPRTAAFAGHFFRGWVEPRWGLQLQHLTRAHGKAVPAWLEAIAATVPLDGTVPLPTPLTVRPGRARLVMSGIGTLAIVFGGGAIAYHVLSNSTYGPQSTVDAYVDALNSGDAAKALSLSDSANSGPLLTDAALRAQNDEDGVLRVKSTHVDRSGRTAFVTVDYVRMSSGDAGTMELTLHRDSHHKHLGIFPSWRLDSATGTVTISAPEMVDSVTVNGQQVSVSDGSATASVFPGTVMVSTAGSDYLTSDSEPVTIARPGDEESVSLTVNLSASGEQAVKDAIDNAVNNCTQEQSLNPSDCPFIDIYAYGDNPTNVHLTAASAPSDGADIEFDSTDGAISISGEFTVAYSYDYVDWDGSTEPEADSDSVSYYGTVTFDDGHPVVTFNS